MQEGTSPRGPSVLEGSFSPTGTAERNPTAPAGRIKPGINNRETGHLWLRTKQCPDRNINGFWKPELFSWYPQKHLERNRPAVRLLLESAFSWEPAPRLHLASRRRQTDQSKLSLNVANCYLAQSLDLHITARHNPLLVLLYQTEPF